MSKERNQKSEAEEKSGSVVDDFLDVKQKGMFRIVKYCKEVQYEKDLTATTRLGSYELTDDLHKCSFSEMAIKS